MMNLCDLVNMSFIEVRQMLRQKEMSWLSFADLVEAQARIGHEHGVWADTDKTCVESQLNAVVEALENRRRDYALDGLSFGVKDVINTKFFRTQFGSASWKGHRAGNDARVVFNLRYEGGILVGKHKTAELAVHFGGHVANPHNGSRVSGSSSSGSAAAIALGVNHVAIATQSLGSIIRPSSYCGVIGFKPTFGWLPRTGVLKTSDVLDHVGLIGRCVDDLQLVFNIARVQGSNHVLKELKLKSAQRVNDAQWRLGLFESNPFEVDPMVSDGVILFQANLNSSEIEFRSVPIPPFLTTTNEQVCLIYHSDLAYYLRKQLEPVAGLASPLLEQLLAEGDDIPPSLYRHQLSKAPEITRSLEVFMDEQGVDFLIFPSAASGAPDTDDQSKTDLNPLISLTGFPCITLPILMSSDGMPVGLSIIARKYHDHLLFDFVKFIQMSGVKCRPDVVFPKKV